MFYLFHAKLENNGHTFLFGCDVRSANRMFDAFLELSEEGIPEFGIREAMTMTGRLADALAEFDKKMRNGDEKLLADITDADDDYDEDDEWWERDE